MIRLVVTDIDGTLLPEGTDQLNPELYDAIRSLKDRGILFAAASGRQYGSMLYLFRPVAEDVLFIAENGSNVMLRGVNLSSNYVDASLAEEVVRYIRTLPDCETALSTPETMYVETENPEIIKLLRDGYHNNVDVTDDLVKLCGRTNKLCVYRGAGIAPVEKQIIDRFGDKLNTMVSGRTWIDFMSMDADKGKALAEIQKLLGISPEETMAFGDNCNDIGMLSRASESYAVANAHPQLKAAARYETLSNTEDGVLKVLRERLLEGGSL